MLIEKEVKTRLPYSMKEEIGSQRATNIKGGLK